MDFDPQHVTGRTMPAQIPVAPHPVAAPAVAPESAEALVAAAAAAAPAPAPALAGAVSSEAASAESRALPPATASLSAPGPGTAISPGPQAKTIHAGSEEEVALLSVLRLLDRLISPGTLSPVERAFVHGAKVILDHLSSECERMLKRTATDLSPSKAAAASPPVLEGLASRQEKAGAARSASKRSRKRTKAAPKAKRP